MNKLSNLTLVSRCNQYFKLANELIEKGFDPEESYIPAPEGWDDDPGYYIPQEALHKLDGIPNSDLGSNYSRLTEPQSLSVEEANHAEPAVIDIITKLQEGIIEANNDALDAINILSSYPSELTNQILLVAKKLPIHINGVFSLSNNILEVLGDISPEDNNAFTSFNDDNLLLNEMKEHLRYVKDALNVIRNITEGMDEDNDVYAQASLLSRALDKIVDLGVKSIKEIKKAFVKKKRVGREDWKF